MFVSELIPKQSRKLTNGGAPSANLNETTFCKIALVPIRMPSTDVSFILLIIPARMGFLIFFSIHATAE
jgi:hypothetical protein